MEENQPGPTHKLAVYSLVFFFLSGMCGLIYQVLWTRVLNLLFGHTTFAIGTVIAAFMGGLALGSLYFGRWADGAGPLKRFLLKQGGSPVFLAYGLMEASVGIYCLLTPFLFPLVEAVYLEFATLPFYALNVLRFLLCVLVLIVPTFLMGGTFPVMSKFFIQNLSGLGVGLGRLYFINTLGAAFGSFLAGIYLLRILGLNATLQCAAVINIGIGVLAFLVNRNPGKREEAVGVKNGGGELFAAVSPGTARLLFVLFAFTGFASMVYEICWTRALVLALGSSIYAFSIMLTTFLLGIALGSMLFGYTAKRFSLSAAAFGWLEIATGLFCIGSIFLLGRMPNLFIAFFPLVRESYDLIILADFLLSFLVMIVPTILMGFVFPLVGRLYTQTMEKIGSSIGDIYSVNTLGCILGAFLTSFFMVPLLGVQNSLKVAVAVNLLSGLIVLYTQYQGRTVKAAVAAAAVLSVLMTGFIPGWNPAVMTSGAAVYAHMYTDRKPNFDEEGRGLLFYRDGISSTVSVHRQGDNIYLKVNGKTDASTSGDMPTQLMLGYLPMLHHPDPKKVFIVGLGSGATAKAVLDFPGLQSVLCAELEPAVLEAVGFFAAVNNRVQDASRFKVRIDDGRNALLASKEKYDVIISEPSNPWIAGVANLYTTEFYQVGKARLNEGGVFCQWFHLYSMNPADVKMVLKTFFSVFPRGAVWTTAGADIILLGSESEPAFDYARWNELFQNSPSVIKSMQAIKMTAPDTVFSYYLADSKTLFPLYKNAYLNTDDRPWLEFSAPRNLYEPTTPVNMRGLAKYRGGPLPPVRGYPAGRPLSTEYYLAAVRQAEAVGDAVLLEKALEEALRIHPTDFELRMFKAQRLIRAGKTMKGERELREIVADNPGKRAGYAALARLYRDQGFPERAEPLYEKAVRMDTGDEELNGEFIAFLRKQKRLDKAAALLEELRKEHPDAARYQFLSGLLRMDGKDYAGASKFFEAALEKKPGSYEVMKNLLAAYREMGDNEKVIRLGEELVKKNPYDREALVDFGKALMKSGEVKRGREMLVRAMQLNPYENREIEEFLEGRIARP
ncbi:MAG: fused MFS/spermidine synthase [Syntrophobacterales bacterium]|nr:fused MFS/spermidine synthase [Syntrophobacterales bacterium]